HQPADCHGGAAVRGGVAGALACPGPAPGGGPARRGGHPGERQGNRRGNGLAREPGAPDRRGPPWAGDGLCRVAYARVRWTPLRRVQAVRLLPHQGLRQWFRLPVLPPLQARRDQAPQEGQAGLKTHHLPRRGARLSGRRAQPV
ncbi:unnamed protein product, partial [Prorocentrum cordatum]